MKFIKNKKIIRTVIVVIIIITIITLFALKKDDVSAYTTTPVIMGNITQTISETGTIKAANELDLNFLNSGKVAVINHEVGEVIKTGTVLSELDFGSLLNKKDEAQASLDFARGNYAKLLAGSTNEDIAIVKASVSQALVKHEAALKELENTKETNRIKIEQAERTLSDLESSNSIYTTPVGQSVKTTHQHTIDKANATALTIIKNKITLTKTSLDLIKNTLEHEEGEDLISIIDPSMKNLTNTYYKKALKLIPSVEANYLNANNSKQNQDVLNSLNEVYNLLEIVFNSLDYCFTALEKSVTSSSFTQTTLDTLKASINLEQTTISTAMSSIQGSSHTLESAILSYSNALTSARDFLTTVEANEMQQITLAESKVNTSLENWKTAKAQLNRTTAQASSHDKYLALARIRQSEAVLNSINRQIDDSIIKAPIDGTITSVNYKVGEQVSSSGKSMITMLGEDNFEIEVLISESDIAKVKKNDLTEISLDAYGDNIKFQGKVLFIEPAETIIQNVVYYKVIIIFEPEGQSLKSGMTANVFLANGGKNNVLLIPSQAIIDNPGNGKIVKVLKENKIIEKQISVGIKGDNGLIEIISGLEENENVITSN